MKIAIVGGGISGLTAGFFLSKNNSVTIFERESCLGGLAASLTNNDWQWPLEKYFHHFFTSDTQLKNLIKLLDLNDKLVYRKAKTSVFANGEIRQFDSPRSIISYPYLSFSDKLRTGLASLLLKINPFFRPLENISAFTLIKKTMGEKTFKTVWQPLLQGKFGSQAKEIPASWFWTRIKKRSFALGYLEGGTEILISKLKQKILQNKGEVLLNQLVDKIVRADGKFELSVGSPGKKLSHVYPKRFDCVLACLPPDQMAKTASQLTLEEKKYLQSFKSLGSLCLILELKNSFLTDQTYWLNINDTSFPFIALVEQTNFIKKSRYNNHAIVYVGGYFPTNHPFFSLDKKELLVKFLPFLKKINKDFDPKEITDFWLFKDSYSQPIIPKNYSLIKPQPQTSLPGLFWLSLHHVYPQDRGVNYAIDLGEKYAKEIEKNKY